MDWWMGCPPLEFCSVKPTTGPLQSPFVRQSFGSLDVSFNEGLLCVIDFKVCTMTAVRLPRLSRPLCSSPFPQAIVRSTSTLCRLLCKPVSPDRVARFYRLPSGHT